MSTLQILDMLDVLSQENDQARKQMVCEEISEYQFTLRDQNPSIKHTSFPTSTVKQVHI